MANETWKFVQAKSKQATKQVLGIRDEKARMKVTPLLAVAPVTQEDDMRWNPIEVLEPLEGVFDVPEMYCRIKSSCRAPWFGMCDTEIGECVTFKIIKMHGKMFVKLFIRLHARDNCR